MIETLRDHTHQHPALAFLISWSLCCALGGLFTATGWIWSLGVLIFFGYFAPRLFYDSQRFGPVRLRLEATEPVVALTFDDGPGPTTEAILDKLQELEVKATFFMIGERVEQHPEMARRVRAEGHTLGNHSKTHPVLLWSDPEGELRETQDIMERVTGVRPAVFRPPYGYKDGRVLEVADRLGLETVNWSINPLDFTEPAADLLVKRVLDKLETGSIILLHDGPVFRRATLEALPLLVTQVRKLGYRFVTL